MDLLDLNGEPPGGTGGCLAALYPFSINAELAQLQEGLRGVLNFGKLVDLHPAVVVKMLSTAHGAAITTDQLLHCFMPRYSDKGSSQNIIKES